MIVTLNYKGQKESRIIDDKYYVRVIAEMRRLGLDYKVIKTTVTDSISKENES